MLAKRKLARFAERTNEGQAGSPARPEGEREAEIDLVPKTRSSKIRTAEGRVLARELALKLLMSCADGEGFGFVGGKVSEVWVMLGA
jgi:hypothetical protein